jgi:carbon storage regulator CsrA
MLVLSRSRDQEIVIDSKIRIRIGEIVGGRVKLLIEAPRECPVRRSEVPAHLKVAPSGYSLTTGPKCDAS